jgi:hypothetical protein
MDAKEICYGCGAASDGSTHPIVAVVREGDRFVTHPVCRTCHQVPKNRTARKIKGHFFERGQAPRALMHAGSSAIQG